MKFVIASEERARQSISGDCFSHTSFAMTINQTLILSTFENTVAERSRKQFGMYGDDVETHLVCKTNQHKILQEKIVFYICFKF